MRALVGILAVVLLPSMGWAAPITFNLRAESIEGVDEVNSFSLTESGLTATLAALPATFNSAPVVLNRTASAFGVNVVATTCDTLEDSAQIDDGCTPESVSIFFNADVFLSSLGASSFGGDDLGLVTIGPTTFNITNTGTLSLANTFLAAGSPWSVAFVRGNGFSFDSFTVNATAVPEPTSLALLGLGLAGLRATRRRAD